MKVCMLVDLVFRSLLTHGWCKAPSSLLVPFSSPLDMAFIPTCILVLVLRSFVISHLHMYQSSHLSQRSTQYP